MTVHGGRGHATAMNCLEVRRQILADPVLGRRMAGAHLSNCPPCTDFAVKTTRLDAEIADALTIPAPPELTQNILGMTLRRLQSRRRVLAAAASFAVVSTAAGFMSFWRDDPMALAGIDFVIEEEANAILTAGPTDPAALTHAMRALRVDLPRQLGELSYIGTCPFRGAIAHHLIATTPQGKVTLLLLPDQRVDEPQWAHARGLRALVRPAGKGSIAMIGDSKRSLERVWHMVLRA